MEGGGWRVEGGGGVVPYTQRQPDGTSTAPTHYKHNHTRTHVHTRTHSPHAHTDTQTQDNTPHHL